MSRGPTRRVTALQRREGRDDRFPSSWRNRRYRFRVLRQRDVGITPRYNRFGPAREAVAVAPGGS